MVTIELESSLTGISSLERNCSSITGKERTILSVRTHLREFLYSRYEEGDTLKFVSIEREQVQ